ncbi:MAG: hypothetical protein QOJ76_2647 [Acidobacteriota bacterium]|jgi:hypothetical protein|nr:hypothetical protein [Acidobacteriota bacterium]
MAALTFKRQHGRDLYAADGDDGDDEMPGRPYYLLAQPDVSAPDELSLKVTWDDRAYRGYYIFVGGIINEEAGFASTVRKLIADRGRGDARFLWFADPNASQLDGTILGVTQTSDSTVTSGDTRFELRNLSLVVAEGIPLSFDGDRASFTIELSAQTPFFMQAERDGIRYFIVETAIGLPLLDDPGAGNHRGTLNYGIKLNRISLFAFGGDVRYFSSDTQTPGYIVQRRYPLLDLSEPDPDGEPYIHFDAQVDVTRPLDAKRTCFAFKEQGAADGYTSYLRTIYGNALQVRPRAGRQPDARLVLAPRPKGVPDDRDNEGFYLAPAGAFEIVPTPRPPSATPRKARATDDETEPVQLLAGLSGTEFISAGIGDLLEFVPACSAFAPAFPLRSGDTSRPLLTDEATTSWLSVVRKGNAPDAQEALQFGYYAQAVSSPYYGKRPGATQEANGSGKILETLAVQVSLLTQGAGVGAPTVFPVVPYGGVTSTASEESSPVNPNTKDFGAFERQIIGAARRQAVPPNPSGPIFKSGRPTKTARGLKRGDKGMAASVALDKPSTGLTPQGLLAELREDGAWKRLVLAKDPSGNESLYFTGAQMVEPKLADALMHQNLFLVISRRKNIGTFSSKATIEGFTLNLAPAGDEKELKAVLLFKFRSDKSLRELANDLSYWVEPQTFNGDDSDSVQETQRYVVDYLEQTAADGRLKDFSERVLNNRNWNGILVINCAIEGSGLPPEIQGLRGGMIGQTLKGHHFGIEVNQVDVEKAIITKSSLFGRILFPFPDEKPGPPPAAPVEGNVKALTVAGPTYDYKVQTLDVVFANSALTDFNCRVLLTMNRMFGREVYFASDPPNTILLVGSYQQHGGVNTFVFTNADRSVFEVVNKGGAFVRILSDVELRRADFTTISTTDVPKSEDKKVSAKFSLDGRLSFNPIKLREGGDFDLFGFGGDSALPFNGLDLTVEFVLRPDGTATGRELNLKPETLSFTRSDNVTPRPGSFTHGFPVTLSGFMYAEKGLGSSKLGGSPLNSPMLTEIGTPSPQYAMDFLLPLGSLGALSSVHISLDAHVILGWGASAAVPDNDAVALFVRLPAVTPGFKGFNLQGVISTKFGDANLVRLDKVYAILFNNVALTVAGFQLPPGVVLDFILFADPKEGSKPSLKNLGWFLAYSGEPK